MKLFFKLILVGVVSGFILGAILKVIQSISGKKVYTLLLNVDYIPILRDWKMTEIVEFLLHVIVSITLVFVLFYVLRSYQLQHRYKYYIAINALIGIVLFFTTSLSDRTPDVMDLVALVYWVFAHMIYGAVVRVLIDYFIHRKM